MIKKYIDRFINKKPELRSTLATEKPECYKDLVKIVVGLISSDEYGDINPETIHEIDDGDYQGTLVYVIGEKGYQPTDYWYLRVNYGSCSACDTLKSIVDYCVDDSLSDSQIDDLVTLCLHIVQGIKPMQPEVI